MSNQPNIESVRVYNTKSKIKKKSRKSQNKTENRTKTQEVVLKTEKTEKTTKGDNNEIIVNQVEPYTKNVIRSSSFSTTCQHCQQKVMTKSVQTFNCGTCLFCCCTGMIIYCVIQLIRGKDICCYDAVHKCPNCKQIIAEYESC